MELVVKTKKTSTGFTSPKSKADIVTSVGIGMKLENIPLKNNPKRPYFMNKVSCSMALITSANIA
jgi:hypothetical protein